MKLHYTDVMVVPCLAFYGLSECRWSLSGARVALKRLDGERARALRPLRRGARYCTEGRKGADRGTQCRAEQANDKSIRLIFFMVKKGCSTLFQAGRQAVAIWLLILMTLVMKDTHANDHFLSEDEVGGLIELLEKTSFDAAGFDRGHGRLMLWEQPDSVRYLFAADELDEEAYKWIKRLLKTIHQTIGRNASIKILPTSFLTEADIVIFCLSKKVLFSSEIISLYFNEVGFSKDDILIIKKEIEDVYTIPGFSWRWVDFNENSFNKFIEVISPHKEKCKKFLPSAFAASLGYGGFNRVNSRMNSVHTISGDFELSDHILLHFLYNSKIKSGMLQEVVLKHFREWILSKNFETYMDHLSK